MDKSSTPRRSEDKKQPINIQNRCKNNISKPKKILQQPNNHLNSIQNLKEAGEKQGRTRKFELKNTKINPASQPIIKPK